LAELEEGQHLPEVGQNRKITPMAQRGLTRNEQHLINETQAVIDSAGAKYSSKNLRRPLVYEHMSREQEFVQNMYFKE